MCNWEQPHSRGGSTAARDIEVRPCARGAYIRAAPALRWRALPLPADGGGEYHQTILHQLLHGPISALSEETQNESAGGHTLLEALQKLFRLQEAPLV